MRLIPGHLAEPSESSSWRAEDEWLLRRLEDESIASALYAFMIGSSDQPPTGSWLHPRAGGFIAELRNVSGGFEAVTAAVQGDLAFLARFVDQLEMKDCPAELIHHLALIQAKVASAFEERAFEDAARAWVRALAAWLVLAEQRTYLARLTAAVVGDGVGSKGRAEVDLSPEIGALELLGLIAQRAEREARDLGIAGRAALLALARTDEAARLAQASAETTRHVRAVAERRRNAAIEAALAVIEDALDEANVRGELATSGRAMLLRAVAVWEWTSRDEVVEHFVVGRIEKIGWELHRTRSWDALAHLLEPFQPIVESLASRIERDPSQIAYSAAVAQMFVFASQATRLPSIRIEHAERAIRICPTHRNGRVVLASLLCDQAMNAMSKMIVFVRQADLVRVEALLARAEALDPMASGLVDARALLARVKKMPISI